MGTRAAWSEEQATAVAEERERIAGELHDAIIQRLFNLALTLHAALEVADERLRPRLESSIAGLDATIREVRATVFALRAADGASVGGLRRRLLDVVIEETDPLGTEPRLQFAGPIESVDGPVAEALGPVLRAALSEAVRETDAGLVDVDIEVLDDLTLRVARVANDGDGGTEELLADRRVQELVRRAEALGGECTIASRAGVTVLTWRVPIHLTQA